MKKLLALSFVLIAVFSMAACGKQENKLVIWSFTNELQTAGDIAHFEEMYTAEGKEFEGMEIEFVVVETATYMQTILPVLNSGKGAPDVLTGELDMIQQFNEAGYLADLQALMEADADIDVAAEKADYQDYIWKSGENADGRLTALSWQVTPGAIFFKVDLAEQVWGSEPGFPQDSTADNYNELVSTWVGENKFDSIQSLQDAQEEVIAFDSQFRLFPDDQAVRHFAAGTNDPESWLDSDGKLNPAKITEQIPYINLVKNMYGAEIADSLTANAGEWSGEWFGAMGEKTTDAAGNDWYVMAYSLPTWGLKYIIEPNMERVDADGTACELPEEPTDADKEACMFKGNWGMATGPNSYFWGGTYLAIREDSNMKDEAYAFVKSMLFDKERLAERQAADGDMYSMQSVMGPAIESYTGRESLGGMNHLDIFNTEASKINLDNITSYDRRLATMLGVHVDKYKEGQYSTLAETLTKFYDEVKIVFPEIYQEGLPTTA